MPSMTTARPEIRISRRQIFRRRLRDHENHARNEAAVVLTEIEQATEFQVRRPRGVKAVVAERGAR